MLGLCKSYLCLSDLHLSCHYIITSSASSCLCSHRHLDNHSLWEGKTFAVRCFKIIMYSIQVRDGVYDPSISLSFSHFADCLSMSK